MDIIHKGFPDPLMSNIDKDSNECALQVAKAISNQWFTNGMLQEDGVFLQRREWIREMRKYSRGQQAVDYYQDLFSRQDEDLSYLNLDWRPDNTGGKYVKLVANGMDDSYYRLGITAHDRLSSEYKIQYRRELEKEMYSRNIAEKARQLFNINISSGMYVPEDADDLDIHMSTKAKAKQEIAQELMLDYVMEHNEWHLISKAFSRDLVECDLAVVECYTDPTNGITLNYVDIEDYIHSYIKKDNGLANKTYEGVVKTITVGDLRRESGLNDDQLRDIINKYASKNNYTATESFRSRNFEVENFLDFKVDVLYYTWKTSKRTPYKAKINSSGHKKLIGREESYLGEGQYDDSETISKTLDVWYEGCYILGSDIVYGWRESENIVHDKLNRARSRYISRTTEIYENQLHSFLSDIIPALDQRVITKLKLQHLIAEIRPSGVEIDWDLLANITGGEKVDYREILSILSAKGIVFKKTYADEFGNVRQGRAVEHIQTGSVEHLIHLLEVLRFQNNELKEITGVNPGADGTLPHDSLVGIQKAQMLATNTITKHIIDAGKQMKVDTAYVISSRIEDIFRFDEFKDIRKMYERAIGKANVDILESFKSMHLHEFGFTIEMLPSDDEINKFEETMKIALQAGKIDEDDVAEAREIAKVNPKYAIQYLKVRKRKRQKELLQMEQARAKAKADQDIRSSNAASENRIKEKMADAKIEVEKARAMAEVNAISQHFINKVNAPDKREQREFELLKEQLKSATAMNLDKFKEDEKLKRQRENNTDHSKMIEQRKKDLDPIDFTSTGIEKLLEGVYKN